jgi:hypothetical protein
MNIFYTVWNKKLIATHFDLKFSVAAPDLQQKNLSRNLICNWKILITIATLLATENWKTSLQLYLQLIVCTKYKFQNFIYKTEKMFLQSHWDSILDSVNT